MTFCSTLVDVLLLQAEPAAAPGERSSGGAVLPREHIGEGGLRPQQV